MADSDSHVWDDYQLSAEIIAMDPVQHKVIYGDYKKGFTEFLEEKYR